MNHIVSYSGGLNSFATAERVKEQHPNEPIVLVFTDTRTEDEDLYRFIDETVEHLGLPFVRLADGRDIWQVFNDTRYMGNSRIDPCSRVLKREFFKRWLTNNYRSDDAILYVGFDWTEGHRLPTMEKRYAPYRCVAPLMDPPYLSKADIKERLAQLGIRHPRLYDFGFAHNNCGGFCVKTGQAQFKLLWEKMPERYLAHEAEQEKLFEKIGKHGFIRRTENGKMQYYTLREFREEILEPKCEVDPTDIGGCGCFV